MWPFARIKQIDAIISGQRPVVMFAGTIDTGKWFFVKQADQTLLGSHTFQSLHHDLVVISCHICLSIDWSKLMLCRSHFVMLCLGRYTHLPELFIDLAHITTNALAKSTKIVIVQLLTLWRHSTKQGTAGIDQILSLEIFIAVDQEIFLLSTDGRNHFLRGGVSKETEQTE